MRKQDTPLITQILIERFSTLYSDCEECLENISKLSFVHKQNQERFYLLKARLEHCMQQIYVHMNLKMDKFTCVDFYSEINSYFANKRNEKSVEFYIQFGYEEEMKREFDPDILSKYFTIENCLPIMRLVPMQLANNARKYMPKGSAFKVEMLITAQRNYIKLINFGPSCCSDEIDSIVNEGVRGNNAEGVAGMGIGLSEVENILSIHKEWLDTTFDIDSDNKNILMINSKPHSRFVVEISYSLSNADKTEKPCLNELENALPLILIHNSMDITANILEICGDMLHINEKNNNLWKGAIYKLKTDVNKMQDTVKLCLYINNDKSIHNLLGNKCRVNLKDVFDSTLKNLCRYYYKEIECDIAGDLRCVNIDSAIYVFIFGICSLIFDNTPLNSILEITYEDDLIMFKCDDYDFKGTFIEEVAEDDSDDDIFSYRFAMYNSMLESWNGKIDVNHNNLIIKF